MFVFVLIFFISRVSGIVLSIQASQPQTHEHSVFSIHNHKHTSMAICVAVVYSASLACQWSRGKKLPHSANTARGKRASSLRHPKHANSILAALAPEAQTAPGCQTLTRVWHMLHTTVEFAAMARQSSR